MNLASRTSRIVASGLSAGMARVVTVLCSFIAMPLCLKYLGVPAFGVWAAITSLLSVLAFADLGIGNGILNMLSAAWGRDDTPALKRILATAVVVLSAIGSIFFAVFLLSFGWVDWAAFFGASQTVPAATAGSAVMVMALILALNIPSTVIQRLQFAMQAGYVNGMAQALGGVLSLLFIYLVSRTDLGLPGMVAATLGAPLLALWVSGGWLFLRSPALIPRARDFVKSQVRPILKSGGQFLILSAVFCLCQASDSLVIAHLLGADEVAIFAVHQKYTSPLAFVGAVVLTPLWAAYAEAHARGDHVWIKRAFRRSVVLMLMAGLTVSLVLLLCLEPAIRFWMKGRIEADLWMTAALLLWISVELVGKAVSMFLHGMGMLGEQIWIALVFLPLCLLAKVTFAQHYGAAGVMVGSTLAYVVVHAWPYWRLVRRWHATHHSDAPVLKASS